MPIGKVIVITQLLQAASAIFLAWRLLHFELSGSMRAMALWQVWTVALSLGTSLLYESAPTAYSILFRFGIPVDAVLMVLAVAELFGLVFARYPGIRSIGRGAIYCAVGAAVAGSYAATFLLGQYGGRKGYAYYVMIVERSTVFTLVLFILIILFFLSRYPMQMPRNFSVSCSLFCAIFLSEAFVLFVDTTNPSRLRNPELGLAQVAVCIVCLISWALKLSPADAALAPTRPPEPESEQQLLEQLENLNQLLSRAARH